MRAEPGDRLGDPWLVGAAFTVGEEDVVAEAPARGPRLDLHEVHSAGGELGETARQPAGLGVAGAREEDRRLPCGIRLGGREGFAAGGGQPREARRVAGLVL